MILKSITNKKVIRPPRMIILGVEKIGKSTFAAGAPNCVFIPVRGEEGIDDIDVDRFPVAESFDELVAALEVLAEGDTKYKTVVIDSATTLDVLIAESCCQEAGVALVSEIGGGFGAGTEAVRNKWGKLTTILDYLRSECGIGSILIGHVKVEKFHDPERESYDQYQFDVNKKVGNDLVRWADFIGFANKSIGIRLESQGFSKKNVKAKVVDNDEEGHYLFTRKSPAHPGGGRGVYGRLEAEIELTWEAFDAAVKEARQG